MSINSNSKLNSRMPNKHDLLMLKQTYKEFFLHACVLCILFTLFTKSTPNHIRIFFTLIKKSCLVGKF